MKKEVYIKSMNLVCVSTAFPSPRRQITLRAKELKKIVEQMEDEDLLQIIQWEVTDEEGRLKNESYSKIKIIKM